MATITRLKTPYWGARGSVSVGPAGKNRGNDIRTATNGKQLNMNKLIILLMLFPVTASADWKAMDYLSFGLGVVTSLLIHEAGHAITAKAYGEELKWKGTSWVCEYPCDNNDKISVAGNLATAIVGEALLHIDNKYRNTPYVDGMQAYNTINPIRYAYKDITQNGGYRDYVDVNDTVEVAIAVHAATIGYRQYNNRLWTVTPRGIQFNVRF